MRVATSIRCLICWSLGSASVLAQPAVTADAATSATPTAASVPLPPLPKSPIEYFRRLLAMSPVALEQALAEKPESQRASLKTKLQEYSSLPVGERDLRLRATELRWYLRPLMEIPAINRTDRLAGIPEDYRKDVKERLEQWDLLPRELQRKMLENEWTIYYFLYLKSSTPAQQRAIKEGLSADRRERLEKELDRLQALPQEQRRRMFENFQEFFELPPREKQKTLGALSDAERRDMEETLQAFEQLPPLQRRTCINSFRKFTNMTAEERAQFLKNADRWKEMTPADRQTWRTLVTQLPPLPPGFGQPPLPPLPPQSQNSPSTPATTFATNSAR